MRHFKVHSVVVVASLKHVLLPQTLQNPYLAKAANARDKFLCQNRKLVLQKGSI